MIIEEMMKNGYYTSEENAEIIEKLIRKHNRRFWFGTQ